MTNFPADRQGRMCKELLKTLSAFVHITVLKQLETVNQPMT